MNEYLKPDSGIIEILHQVFDGRSCIDCGQQADRLKGAKFYCNHCLLNHEPSRINKFVGFYDFSRIFQSPLPIEYEESIVENYSQDDIVDFIYRKKESQRTVKHNRRVHK